MKTLPKWQRDEMKFPGVDFADLAEVDMHQQIQARDVAEFEAIIKRIGLAPEHTLIDLGAGGGEFAVHAAKHCRCVWAVDASPAMLDCARARARQEGVDNIKFVHAGFLTYEHADEPVDVVVSHTALHHLPDMWKGIALARVAAMLADHGRLHLRDLAFRFDPADYVAAFESFLEMVETHLGSEIIPGAEATLRDEFPTWDWVWEGLLRRAGFRIDLADYRAGLAEYLCTKEVKT